VNKKKSKILYFIQLPPPVHGVSVINKLAYNNHVINRFFEKKLIRINFSTEIEELRQFSVKKLGTFISTLFKLKWILIRFRPDLVYFSLIPVGSGFIRDAIYALTIKLLGKKVVYHLHNRGIPRYKSKPLYSILYKWVFNNSAIIHVSESLMLSEIKLLKLSNTKTFVLGNTIEEFIVNKRDRNNEKLQLLFLSNYFPEKGLMTLLEAIRILKEKSLGIKLNAYGSVQSKDEEVRCRKFVEEHDLTKYVSINGPVFDKEKYKVFENADIFIFPSYFREECVPVTILEAMNAKLPVIATNIGAIPEMIEDGKDGILVDPMKPARLAQKIDILIKDESLRKELGQNAYRRFKKTFSYSVFENEMSAIFDNILNK
jgi:glycosyltransferase involved in cell wall biosynthesis